MNRRNFGLLLIVIGIIMTTITGFNVATRGKVVDVGPVRINTNKSIPVEWSPVLGGVILIAGILVILTRRGK
jgi:hypothetical protein